MGLAGVALVVLLLGVWLYGREFQGAEYIGVTLWSLFCGLFMTGITFGVMGLKTRSHRKTMPISGIFSNLFVVGIFITYLWWPTPNTLVSAAESGDVDRIRRCLSLGVDVNAVVVVSSGRRVTALIRALEADQQEVIKLLVTEGADLSLPDSRGNSPLLLATASGRRGLIELLLERGAEPNHGAGEQNALYKAAGKGDLGTIELLLRHGADVNLDGTSPLIHAAKAGQLKTIELLLQHNADVDQQDHQGDTALHQAATHGHSFAVDKLLRRGADPNLKNHNGETALDRAIEAQHQNIVRNLLNAGARMDLFTMIALNRSSQVEQLIDEDLSLVHAEKQGRTPLHEATKWGSVKIVRLLLDYGAKINTRFPKGTGVPALHTAILRDSTDLVELLLSYGADPNLSSKSDSINAPPIYHAVIRGNEKIVANLLRHGAEVNAHCDTDSVDGPPIYFAVQHGHKGIVELLLDHHADVNGRHSSRSPTPLHEAIRRADFAMVELLVQRGADLQLTSMGYTPLRYAMTQRPRNALAYDKVIDILQDAGAGP